MECDFSDYKKQSKTGEGDAEGGMEEGEWKRKGKRKRGETRGKGRGRKWKRMAKERGNGENYQELMESDDTERKTVFGEQQNQLSAVIWSHFLCIRKNHVHITAMNQWSYQ